MADKLLITRYNDEGILSILTDRDGHSVWMTYAKDGQKSIVGNIYAGRVLNIAKNMNAAFVEYEKGINGFIHLDKQERFIFLNQMRSDGPVRQGDLLLVMAVKEPAGIKGASLTADSKKIRKSLADDGCSDEIVDDILARAKDHKPGLIRPVLETFVKDALLLAADECDIVTDDSGVFLQLKRHFDAYDPELAGRLNIYRDRQVGFGTVYQIEKRVREALDKKVYLRSGAFIVIEPTEALVVVDVNSGKSITGNDPESKYLEVNLEACTEIARQIRLRNLSGIIVIDFINMKSEDSQNLLMEELRRCLLHDPLKPLVIDMTALGLVEITRKKVRRPLYENLS